MNCRIIPESGCRFSFLSGRRETAEKDSARYSPPALSPAGMGLRALTGLHPCVVTAWGSEVLIAAKSRLMKPWSNGFFDARI